MIERIITLMPAKQVHFAEVIIGSAISLALKVASAGIIFVMNILIARQLGASASGAFFLAFTLVTLMATAGRLGLDQAVLKLIAAARSQGNMALVVGIYRQSLSWVVTVCILIAVAIWTARNTMLPIAFSTPNLPEVMTYCAWAIPLVAIYTMHAQMLQSMQLTARAVIVLNCLMPLVTVLLLIALPATNAITVSQYFLLSCTVCALLGTWFWHSQAAITATRSQGNAKPAQYIPAIEISKLARPLWVVTLLAQVSQWAPLLLLGIWASAQDIAFFATAQRTALLTSLVMVSVNAVAAPKFAALHAQGETLRMRQVAIWSVRLMLVAALPILSFILAFPAWVMSFFGEEFRIAAPALCVLAVGQFVNISCGPVGYLLSMTGHQRALRNNAIISTLVGIALGLLLIPSYGLMGACIAAASAVSLQNVLGVLQVRRHLGFNTLKFWQQ